jgi:hypothetical protein
VTSELLPTQSVGERTRNTWKNNEDTLKFDRTIRTTSKISQTSLHNKLSTPSSTWTVYSLATIQLYPIPPAVFFQVSVVDGHHCVSSFWVVCLITPAIGVIYAGDGHGYEDPCVLDRCATQVSEIDRGACIVIKWQGETNEPKHCWSKAINPSASALKGLKEFPLPVWNRSAPCGVDAGRYKIEIAHHPSLNFRFFM